MDRFGNILNEWNRRLSRLPWRPPSTYLHPMYQPGPSHALLPPMPMMGLFRQPPPAHLSETMYVAERTGQKLFPGQGVERLHEHLLRHEEDSFADSAAIELIEKLQLFRDIEPSLTKLTQQQIRKYDRATHSEETEF